MYVMEYQQGESIVFEMMRDLKPKETDEIERAIQGIYMLLEENDKKLAKLLEGLSGRKELHG